ncbi:hypothetical protein HWI77_12180 [Acinetobacter venetianus]|uniref:hypothetical protein n=1 Tax=Acinetobacter venetianus TaxID=52133 RepID=UPI0007759D71|nr:hypothetical protein [Acinetobacter venetianus]MDA0696304.1 hypothetical protein [Pseudomonadota bacterium]KXO73506.1 hypothetical protein AYL20_13920 [Acinetobacter venetianus]KXO85459.1 hypothetical protein AYK86_04455 [Acinetobacter venetianus]MCR4531123.1 hypothetical protein [Acinetobacter venetianus]MDA1254453.1 hypothetical protein [Pseudomonadota bacterium]
MRKLYLLLAVLTCNGLVHADENPYMPEPKLKDANVSTWNIGAGFTKKLLHANLEWVNPYGIAYAKAGAFLNDENPVGGQIGFRYPYYLTGTDKNGYYIGAYAGHIESKQIDGEEKARLGAGVDLAFVWLNSERISTFSVGIGAGERLKNSRGDVIEKTEPTIQFSYTLSFGL